MCRTSDASSRRIGTAANLFGPVRNCPADPLRSSCDLPAALLYRFGRSDNHAQFPNGCRMAIGIRGGSVWKVGLRLFGGRPFRFAVIGWHADSGRCPTSHLPPPPLMVHVATAKCSGRSPVGSNRLLFRRLRFLQVDQNNAVLAFFTVFGDGRLLFQNVNAFDCVRVDLLHLRHVDLFPVQID